MFKFVAILLVSCLALASATNVKRCKFLDPLNPKHTFSIYARKILGKNGQPFPLSVDVKGCDQPPCDVIKGSSAIMDVQFVGSKY